MTYPNVAASLKQQQGAAFLILVFMLGVAAASLILTIGPTSNDRLATEEKTFQALTMARDALMGYAASAGTNVGAARPGDLPCPATDFSTGIAQACNSLALRIGYLPWNTLGLPDLRDGSGAPLLYAVSERFKTNPRNTTQSLNSDTSGEYSVSGQNVVAIVFAPGPALSTQDRSAATFNVVNFLELENADGDTTFENSLETDNFNDRLLWITPQAFFPPLELRAVRIAQQRLLHYFGVTGRFPMSARYLSDTACWDYGGRLPYPGLGTHPCLPGGNGATSGAWTNNFPDWFWNNFWDYVIHYAPARRCVTNPGTICGGSGNYLTVGTQNNIRALLIRQGVRTPATTCSTPSQCLDDAENTDQDPVYVVPSAGNDRMTIVSP
jgi:hypothetical protein